MLSTISGILASRAIAAIASTSQTTPPGLAIELDEDRLGLFCQRGAKRVGIVGIGPLYLPAKVLEGVVELVDRAAVKLGRGDKFVARLHQGMKDESLRGVAGGDAERRRRAFEGGDALFEHRRRRVGDARINIAERLQAKQRRRVIDVVKYKRGGLVDRRDARARRRIGPRPGVNGEGGETGLVVAHRKNSGKKLAPLPSPLAGEGLGMRGRAVRRSVLNQPLIRPSAIPGSSPGAGPSPARGEGYSAAICPRPRA